MTQPGPLRFFWVVLRPPMTLATLCLLVPGLGVLMLLKDPSGFDQTLALTLLLQMFAASTGYFHAATRGHFDAVLTSSRSRLQVALAHFAISTLPGVVVWLALAVIDGTLRPGHWTTALMPSALAALVYVSVVAWSLTLPCPRYTGASLWFFSIVLLAATTDLQQLRTHMGEGRWMESLQPIATALVCPIVMLAEPASSATGLTASVAASAAATLAVALWLVCRMEIPLTDRA